METHERLTYREIGKRLGITPDAARMKAKREAKAKRWRIIPGNHPQDPVHVDVPIGTLPEQRTDAPEATPPTRHDGSGWESHARNLTARVAQLTDALVAEKDAHMRTLSELAAAETRELGTTEELRAARREIQDLSARLKRRRWVRT